MAHTPHFSLLIEEAAPEGGYRRFCTSSILSPFRRISISLQFCTPIFPSSREGWNFKLLIRAATCGTRPISAAFDS